MKSVLNYNGNPITIYSIELCHYGENGDYEAFPDRELHLDLNKMVQETGFANYIVEYIDDDVLIFNRDDVGFTLFSDGRLIIESLSPGTDEQAIELAAGIIGYSN